MTIAIFTSGLTKNFGSTRALDGLDLSVKAGEVHGFLGPNGSGKTTTIRVLLGLLHADSGNLELLGKDPWRDAVELHRRLAYVPGEVSLWPNLTGGEVIDLFGRLRGDFNRRRCDELLERFLLDPTKKTGSYSKGNRQKVALVAALASDAELLEGIRRYAITRAGQDEQYTVHPATWLNQGRWADEVVGTLGGVIDNKREPTENEKREAAMRWQAYLDSQNQGANQ